MHIRQGTRCIVSAKTLQRACEFLPLETRLMLHGGCELADVFLPDGSLHFDSVNQFVHGNRETTLPGTSINSGPGSALPGPVIGGVPALSSNPSATATLYLDFDGEPAQSWGSHSVTATPAYSTDSDTANFSDSELSNIHQIWARVAEKYSPFNIDVTTINPGSFADKVATKVVIGGNGSWTGQTYGGIAYIGGFYNSSSNTVWVFEDNLGNGNAKYTAEAAAHEAGHAFGLRHQSLYDANGVKTQEYYQGNSAIAPTMGNSYYAARGLWYYGTSTSATTYQDDLAILSNTSNAFGYRADDFGNVIGSAASAMSGASTFNISGVIEKMTDKDFFSFTTDAGTVSLMGSVVAYGATLDLKLELFSASGQQIAIADTTSFGESLSLPLSAGTYYVAVGSHGGYGDVGQYTLSGTIVQPVNYVAAPANLTTSVISAGQVNVAWTDQSANEAGFTIQRSTDGGSTWVNLATLPTNATSFSDMAVQGGVMYLYRVYAEGAAVDSAFSNTGSATIVPSAPTGLVAAGVSTSQINLTWLDVSGETGYRIERSLDGSSWSQVGTTSADITSFQNTGLAGGTSYYYRVFAVATFGNSPASATALGVTQALALPAAPTSVTAAKVARTKMRVTWNDNATNESGFRVQRSTDGRTWTQIGTAPANATSYTDVIKTGAYYYRVSAYNAAGESAFSEAAYASMSKTTANATVTHAQAKPVFSSASISETLKARSIVADLLAA